MPTLTLMGELEANEGRDGLFVYGDWGGLLPNKGEGRVGEGEEEAGPKAEEEEGEAGREGGEGRGGNWVPLLIAYGQDLHHSVWG